MSTEFTESRCTFPIHLHPSRLGQVREGVEEQLNALLMTFVEELGGVFLSYSDLTLVTSPDTNPLQCGKIFQERSYIHFEVQVKALTWKVGVGERYTGVVNSVAGDHLSILLHGAFNATIPLSGHSIPKSWQYEQEKERWIDSNLFDGDAEEKADDDDGSVKEEETAATPAKKLTKKELKKLERRRLRDVMLAASGRGNAAAKQPRPAKGVITRGVHIRFECSAVQHGDEYFKLTGIVVPKKNAVASGELGLTGGFTPLAPIVSAKKATDEEGEEGENGIEGDGVKDEEGDFDMSALAAVTAPNSAAASKRNSFSTPAKSHPSPHLTSATAAAAPSTQKKVHTDKQQAKYAKKQAKLAERLAAKQEAGTANNATTPMDTGDDDEDAPITKSSSTKTPSKSSSTKTENGTEKKKRKGEEADEEGKEKKRKKMKLES